MSNKPKGAFISAGVLAAIASSLCCIGPLIAILGGVSGAASTFSWIEPARPYLIGGSALALGVAFWQAYKPVKVDDCGCEVPEKKKFFETKGFLWGITVFSVLMFSFPYYSDIFYPESASTISIENQENFETAEFIIEGMTCEDCERHVTQALLKGGGVSETEVSFESGIANATFDNTLTTSDELAISIEKETGYTVSTVQIITENE
jgi:copper chaperone CopZ